MPVYAWEQYFFKKNRHAKFFSPRKKYYLFLFFCLHLGNIFYFLNKRLKALSLTTLIERRQRGDMIQLYIKLLLLSLSKLKITLDPSYTHCHYCVVNVFQMSLSYHPYLSIISIYKDT